MKYKVVFIDYNFIDKRYPNSPEDGDKFFTYGHSSLFARQFKKYYPDFEVECWKADSRIKNVSIKLLDGVKYQIFPSIRFGGIGHFSRKLLKAIKQEILNNNFRLIINISSFRHLLFYSIAIRNRNIPIVVQHHGEASAIYKYKINSGVKKLFYLLQIPFEKLSFKNVDVLFVLDERIKNYLPRNNHLRIFVSTTGVDENIFQKLDKVEAKKILGWDVNKKYILHVGRLNYTKGIDILIDIFKEFKEEKRNDIELVLAGTEKSDRFYQQAWNAGAIIYPVIFQTELYKFLSAADVYVLPRYSIQHKFGGIGMLPVQAMLCGTPVVGDTLRNIPNKNDIQEIGIHANTKSGIKDAILKIIYCNKKFDRLREIAIKYYSWQKICENAKFIYDNLIENYEKN